MANKNIKGLTVEIGGNTTKLTEALADVEKEGNKLSGDLKDVNNLLKLDPSNVEALAQKQKILSEAVGNTSAKLKELEAHQEEIKKQFENGEIDRGAYLKFQQEIAATENQLKGYAAELEKVENEEADTGAAALKAGKDAAKGADDAEKSGDKWKKFGAAAKAAAEVAAAAVTAAAAATTALVKGIADAASETAAFGDNIDKASQKLGVSAEFYQEWDAVLQHSGTSMDAMGATFKKLAAASQKASKDQAAAFEQLGLSLDQVKQMSAEELFTSVVSGLQQMEEGTERTAIATQLLGKGAQELGPLLNTSAEDTQGMIDTVRELGGVMSNDAVKASAAYEDAMQDFNTVIDGAKRNISAEFLPAITGIINGLKDMMTGNDGIKSINAGIKGFADTLKKELPRVLKTGTEIIKGLASSLIENIPFIASAALDVVNGLVDGIIENLPGLMTAAVEVVLTLANGIADSLPELVPTLVQVILDITDILIQNVPMIVDAALAIILGLSDGIFDALPVLIDKLPELIASIVQALYNSYDKIFEAGKKLLGQITEAIPSVIKSLTAALPQIITSIVGVIKDSAPEMVQSGIELLTGLVDAIPEAVIAIVDALPEIITAIVEALIEAAPQMIDAGFEVFTALIKAIPEAIISIVAAIPEITDAIISAFKEVDWVGLGIDLMKSIGKGLVEGVKNIGGLIKEAAGGIANGFTNLFGLPSIEDIGNGISGLADKGAAAVGAATTFIQNNYSPTALTRDAIARDTKNGLLLMNAR